MRVPTGKTCRTPTPPIEVDAAAIQIKLFVSIAEATDNTGDEFRAGEKYALLVFSRQCRGETFDYEAAREALETRGWENVTLTEASVLSVESLNSAHPAAQACYEAALRTGFAALVFTDPVE